MLSFVIGSTISSAWAQCAMCKTVIENNISEGSNLANGLNMGITYLATMPYLAVMAIVFLLYRASKKRQRENMLKFGLRN
jgi:hypothetical protein